MCLGAGARLCTADEIQNGETSLTGCGFDTRHVWTKSQGDCGAGEVLTVMGSPEFQDDDPPRCTSMIDPRINLALGKPARADSELVRDGAALVALAVPLTRRLLAVQVREVSSPYQCATCGAAQAVDGEFTNKGRWISTNEQGHHWLAVDLLHTHRITSMSLCECSNGRLGLTVATT